MKAHSTRMPQAAYALGLFIWLLVQRVHKSSPVFLQAANQHIHSHPRTMTTNNNNSTKPNNFLPAWLPSLVVAASLGLPPILLVIFYQGCSPVSLHLKIWQMMEYRIDKGACDIPLAPKQQQLEQEQGYKEKQ